MKFNFFLKTCFLTICVFVLFSCSDNKEHTYSTWEDLSKASENQLTWIPSFLLQEEAIINNIYDIVACHDLDTNVCWGKMLCYQPVFSWVKTLNNQVETLNIVDWDRLSELGLEKRQVVVFKYKSWNIVVGGNSLFYFGE